MGEAAIEARRLTKSFRRGLVAVKDLDLAVVRGTVYGLVGRNGSGKTTALRLLLGLLQPDAGTARVLGWDFWKAPRRLRRRVAYISQSPQTPAAATLEDVERFQSRFNEKWDSDFARTLARRWDLPWSRALNCLSSGQQRQIALLTAFAGRPEVLILDEPASGFDLVARHALLDQLVDALTQNDGCTVLLSTHNIGDLERIADHIGVLERGRIALAAPKDDLLSQTRRIQVVLADAAAAANLAIPGALVTRRNGAVVSALVRWTSGSELELLQQTADARIECFPVGLEEIFLELYGQQPNEPDESSPAGSAPGNERGNW